jgi:peroxiredoxin
MSILSVGQSAPQFSLGGLDGKSYALNKNGARLTLAVFFKTTCPTCMLSWQYIEKYHQRYRGAGLAVWGISPDSREASAQYAAKYGSTFPILLDGDWRVSKTYDPEFVPTMLLIDADGKIIDSSVSWDKNKFNHVSQTIAAKLHVPAAIIAPPNDGSPEYKAG